MQSKARPPSKRETRNLVMLSHIDDDPHPFQVEDKLA